MQNTYEYNIFKFAFKHSTGKIKSQGWKIRKNNGMCFICHSYHTKSEERTHFAKISRDHLECIFSTLSCKEEQRAFSSIESIEETAQK